MLYLYRFWVKKLRKFYFFDLKFVMDCWLLSVIYFFMFCMWGSILVLLIVNSIFGFNIFFLIKFFVKGISEVVFLIG